MYNETQGSFLFQYCPHNHCSNSVVGWTTCSVHSGQTSRMSYLEFDSSASSTRPQISQIRANTYPPFFIAIRDRLKKLLLIVSLLHIQYQ